MTLKTSMRLFGMVLLGCIAQAGTKATMVYHYVEKAHTRVLEIYKEADLTFTGFMGQETVDKRRLRWKAEIEAQKKAGMGEFQLLEGYTKSFEAARDIESNTAKAYQAYVDDMKAGKQVASKPGFNPMAFVGTPDDSKTPEQRIKEYASDIEKYSKETAAHEKASKAYQEALDGLWKLAK